jgi:4-amino-4-deoxy-L-arabinose transferase-like glycosyltransferase
VDCTTLQPTGAAPFPLDSPGATGLQQDGDHYHVNWQTNAEWAGSCRRVTLRVPAASNPVAFFRFHAGRPSCAAGPLRPRYDPLASPQLANPAHIVPTTSFEPGEEGLPTIAAVAVALAMACCGQYLLTPPSDIRLSEAPKQAIGGALLIAGALVFGAASRRRGGEARLEFPHAALPLFTSITAPSLPWLLCAIALGAGAAAAFAVGGESPAVVFAWLASIAALFLSQRVHLPLKPPRIAREPRRYLAALGVSLVAALLTRSYNLSALPYNVDGDFAGVGLAARALAAGPRQIFGYDFAGVPTLGYLPPALTMMLFGDGLAGLNASGVVAGLLSIFGVYLVGRDLFHPRVGVFASALLTVSYAHLAASRQSHYLDPLPFLLFSVYFLLLGLREDRGWAIVASGALAALCTEMYFSGRIVAPITAFLLLYLLVFNGAWLRQRRRTVALWMLAIVITLGPMLVVFVRDSDSLIRRAREVSILNPEIIRHEETVYQTHSLTVILLEQARRTALLFNHYPDRGTQFALLVPLLDPVTAVLFTLGVGHAIVRWRMGSAVLVPWTALVLFLGGVLVANPPYWPHLFVLLPPAALFAALALNQLYEILAPDRQHHPRARTLAATALIAMLALVGVQNWNTYVAAKGAYATPRTRIGRYLAALPSAASVYLVSNDFHRDDREFQFLAPGRLTGDLSPRDVEANPSLVDRATVLILTSDQQMLLRRLEGRFPGGSAETHVGNDANEVAFMVFRPGID